MSNDSLKYRLFELKELKITTLLQVIINRTLYVNKNRSPACCKNQKYKSIKHNVVKQYYKIRWPCWFGNIEMSIIEADSTHTYIYTHTLRLVRCYNICVNSVPY